jgi:hypothetical protein
MGTLRCRDASFGFSMCLEPQFSHDAFHSFMIDGPSLLLQWLGDVPIAIAWSLSSHGCNGSLQRLLISSRRAMIRGTAGTVQDFTNLRDRILLCYHLHHRPFLPDCEVKSIEALFAMSSCIVS